MNSRTFKTAVLLLVLIFTTCLFYGLSYGQDKVKKQTEKRNEKRRSKYKKHNNLERELKKSLKALKDIEIYIDDIELDMDDVDFVIPDIDFDIPEIDFVLPDLEIEIPDFEIDIPDMDFELPEINFDFSEFDIDIDIDIPEINFDLSDIDMENSVISIPKFNFPDIEFHNFELPEISLPVLPQINLKSLEDLEFHLDDIKTDMENFKFDINVKNKRRFKNLKSIKKDDKGPVGIKNNIDS